MGLIARSAVFENYGLVCHAVTRTGHPPTHDTHRSDDWTICATTSVATATELAVPLERLQQRGFNRTPSQQARVDGQLPCGLGLLGRVGASPPGFGMCWRRTLIPRLVHTAPAPNSRSSRTAPGTRRWGRTRGLCWLQRRRRCRPSLGVPGAARP